MFLISEAHAQAAPAAQSGGNGQQFILIGGVFVLMYFMMIRPQMKRAKEQKNLISKLAKGDEVLTISGFVGRVTDIRDQYVVLELSKGNGSSVLLQKAAIQTVLPSGTMKGL